VSQIRSSGLFRFKVNSEIDICKKDPLDRGSAHASALPTQNNTTHQCLEFVLNSEYKCCSCPRPRAQCDCLM